MSVSVAVSALFFLCRLATTPGANLNPDPTRLSLSMQPAISAVLVAAVLLSLVVGAPTPSQSARPSPAVEPAFVPDPSGRGTIGLVTSCVLTLSLCVWTALHLNCYAPGTSSFTKFWIKATWAGIALIAPEYVLWHAIHQWETARQLCNEVNEYLFPKDNQTENLPEDAQSQPAPPLEPSTSGELPVDDIQTAQPEAHTTHQVVLEPSTSNASRNESIEPLLEPSHPDIERPSETELDIEKNQKHRWKIEHGFFAVMGGFQITVTQKEYEWVLEAPKRILTPKGIVFFAKHGLLPDLPSKRLKERGKADQLAKTLVCAQAIWMVIQTIARKASGLPITLLELNTLAHVGCAVFMYLVWWKKPQNVSVLIDVPISPRLGAALSSPSLGWFARKDERPLVDEVFSPQNEQARLSIPESKVEFRVEDMASKFHIEVLNMLNANEIRSLVRLDGVFMLLANQGLEESPFYNSGALPQHLTQMEVTKLTSKSLLGEEDDITRDLPLFHSVHWFITSQASNHSIHGNLQAVSELKPLVILTALGMLYAGIHASSWNEHFPTKAEAILWQVAVCYIGASGFIAIALLLIPDNIDHGPSQVGRLIAGSVNGSMLVLVIFLLGILVACRCYLIIEAFISIRSLPLGSYSTVTWVNFLPHFG